MDSGQASVNFVVCYLVFFVCLVCGLDHGSPKDNLLQTNQLKKDGQSINYVKQMLDQRCGRRYSMPCLKLDLLKLVDRLEVDTDFQILPGVHVTRSSTFAKRSDNDIFQERADASLDSYLFSRFANYLNSLSVNIKILDPSLVKTAKRFGEEVFGADTENTFTGRKKKYSHALATAGLMSGGSMLAAGLMTLAAMAGKALMMSMMALLLSAMSAMKGGGDQEKKSTTYEIITKPVVTHAHTHSSEVQHVDGSHGHGASHSGYGYARSMAFTPVYPLLRNLAKEPSANDKEQKSQQPYRAHDPDLDYKIQSLKEDKNK
ncbi:hypothetical protein LSTR_LSTR010295 [Laodelphax striatellus]|uniref:Osiris 16 n=1 Tax=Laodelphax striatellus TaxID=195883 RepID=A0A482XQU7_LAOST|nr:hypothetical protein LSTR_LSTR010295 [Laodelphax striatellus]